MDSSLRRAINMEESSTQRQPLYKCRWESCNHTEFKNRTAFKTHIGRHTGKPEDTYFSLLLDDQAKALTTSPEQMKWHPVVLRWCLQQFSRSKSGYEAMRTSGFIKLPSGRTLMRYRNYRHPETGWRDECLMEMRTVYKEFVQSKRGRPDRSHFGVLAFDEMKIKEGLLWDSKSNELIGFVDLAEDQDDSSCTTPEDSLATHVLQFHWKSVFAPFTYPCAYFFSKSLGAHQINQIFWRGVSKLHDFGLIVIGSICDGAAPNRKFMRENSSSTLGVGRNPFGDWPLFMFSDPTHLVKKLRNNLSRSGHGRGYSRTLRIGAQCLTWSQVEDVVYRERSRLLRFTPLRKEHVNLDSFTRMRSRLAYDIFNARVEMEMMDSVPTTTVAMRQYLQRVRALIEVFGSRRKMHDPRDALLEAFQDSVSWFTEWKSSCTNNLDFVSLQVYEDMQMTRNALTQLITFIATDARISGMKLYLLPGRLNQDFVEGYFGLQRSIGGSSCNMTAQRYGYQTLTLAQSHIIPRNLQHNAVNLPLPMSKK
eukprot:scpid54974/ scgid5965/ Transposable element P transposase